MDGAGASGRSGGVDERERTPDRASTLKRRTLLLAIAGGLVCPSLPSVSFAGTLEHYGRGYRSGGYG
jgi:hypothetical protein